MSEDQRQDQESEEFYITFEQRDALLEYLSYSPINKERYIKAYTDYKNKLSIEFLHENYIVDFNQGRLFNRKTNKELGFNVLGYKAIKIKNKTILLHIMIFAMYHNRWPDLGMLVDHDDNNPLNNSISNLKEVDHEANNENTKIFNNGIRVHTLKNGVKKFHVQRFKVFIGSFNTHEEAMNASLNCKKEDVLKG